MALLFSDSGVMEVWPDGWLACIEGWGEVFWSLSKKNVFKKLNQVLIWLVHIAVKQRSDPFLSPSLVHLFTVSISGVLSTLAILHHLTTHSSVETPNLILLGFHISLLTTSLFSHTNPSTHYPTPRSSPKQLILFNYTTHWIHHKPQDPNYRTLLIKPL